MILIDKQTMLRVREDDFIDWAASQLVFVSSTITDMQDERSAVRGAIERVGATPVMWENMTPAQAGPDEVYKSGVLRATIYLLILNQRYGRRQANGFSATEEEYETAKQSGKKILIWTKSGVAREQREGNLNRWIDDLQLVHSIGSYSSPEDLALQAEQALRRLAEEETCGWAKIGDAILPYDKLTETPGLLARNSDIEIRFKTRDGRITSYMDRILSDDSFREHVLTVDGRTFLVRVKERSRDKQGTEVKYSIRLSARVPETNYMVTLGSLVANSRSYSRAEILEAAVRAMLFGQKHPALQTFYMNLPEMECDGILNQEVDQARKLRAVELIACESVCNAGLLERCEVRASFRGRRLWLQVHGEATQSYWPSERTPIEVAGETRYQLK